LASEVSHDLLVETENAAAPGERDKYHLSALARLEPDGCSGGDIKAQAARCRSVEVERRVCLGKMIVASDLNRAVARVGDNEDGLSGAGIQCDLAIRWQNFSWNHNRGNHDAPPLRIG
jgi:hypothetical protein